MSLNSGLLTELRAKLGFCRKANSKCVKEKNKVSSTVKSPLKCQFFLCSQWNPSNSEMLVCVWLSRSCGCAVTVANSESLCVHWSSTGESGPERAHSGVKSKHWDLHVSLGQTETERLDLQGPPKCHSAIHSCPNSQKHSHAYLNPQTWAHTVFTVYVSTACTH